jgi:predicted enzyme involved in methoxymalonyl-ACP biosynthesis
MMNDSEFNDKLSNLMRQIETLPPSEQDRLRSLAEETKERQEKLKTTVNSLQESLDYLRLSIKYLVFDLEATRRENQYLRKLLSDARGPGNSGNEAAD